MEYRNLGSTDMKVSVICLGSWVFGGDCWGRADDEESIKVVRRALEKGINFVDTAPVYGSGRAERVIGRAVRNMPERPLIATKCGLQQKGRSIRPNLSAEFIREEVENSLRRLDIDRIDLYQCHWPDPRTSPEETFSELTKLRDEGKIRYAGVSNFEKKDMCKALELKGAV
ncbi:MAG: aldo/keto reductase, partial [Candidatus Omnitrophica bacterium]|nr:aldo/keto reductase [Candidatus Omnitrophota bacterium]